MRLKVTHTSNDLPCTEILCDSEMYRGKKRI